MFEELITYDKIKKAWIKTWKNGHIQVKLSWCNHPECFEFYGPLKLNHVEVFGHFNRIISNARIERKTFSLGNSLKEVLENLDLHNAHILGVERLAIYLIINSSRTTGTDSP